MGHRDADVSLCVRQTQPKISALNRAGAHSDSQVKIKYVQLNLIYRQCLDIQIKYVKFNFSMLNLMLKKI